MSNSRIESANTNSPTLWLPSFWFPRVEADFSVAPAVAGREIPRSTEHETEIPHTSDDDAHRKERRSRKDDSSPVETRSWSLLRRSLVSVLLAFWPCSRLLWSPQGRPDTVSRMLVVCGCLRGRGGICFCLCRCVRKRVQGHQESMRVPVVTSRATRNKNRNDGVLFLIVPAASCPRTYVVRTIDDSASNSSSRD